MGAYVAYLMSGFQDGRLGNLVPPRRLETGRETASLVEGQVT